MKKYIVLAIIFLVACNKETNNEQTVVTESSLLKSITFKIVGDPTNISYYFIYDELKRVQSVLNNDRLEEFRFQYTANNVDIILDTIIYRAEIQDSSIIAFKCINNNNGEILTTFDVKSDGQFIDSIVLDYKNIGIYTLESKNYDYSFLGNNCVQYVNNHFSRVSFFEDYKHNTDTIKMTYYDNLINDKVIYQYLYGQTSNKLGTLELGIPQQIIYYLGLSGYDLPFRNANLLKTLNNYTFKYYYNTKNQIKRVEWYYPDPNTKIYSIFYEYY
jgi:uncharacterized protein YegP (UPF0339 family)